jgi:ParB family transcriptional regulator, chromosome partitioning protein
MTIGERIDRMNPQRCLICHQSMSVARDWPVCPACKFDQTSPEAYAIRRARGLLWRSGITGTDTPGGPSVTTTVLSDKHRILTERRQKGMSTVNVIVAPRSTESDNPLVQEIGLDQIRPSKANPRRRVDDSAMAELAQNIRTHGVLQPILVRPRTAGGYEIVCGERRWRASKTAGKDTIPARIVNLSDAEALELGVIENLQRENVHELDEALGYKALIKQDPALYTVETLAAKVGRSATYIYQRLKLAELTPNLQKAFYEGKLTAGHAQEIARLQPRDQERALTECFPGHRTTKAILKDKDPRPISVRELRDWIQRDIHLSLANAPFDVNDSNLVPAAGPCSTCPKRSGNNPLLFADSIPRKDVCTDRECFHAKIAALVELRIKQAEEAGEKPVRVSDASPYYGGKVRPGVIYPPDYHEAGAAGECSTTIAAVVVEGKQAGRKLYVCTNKKCPTHAAHSLGLNPEERTERKKQAAELRVQQEYRKRLIEEVWKRVPAELSRHELDLIAQNYFHVLGHDSQHRIFKFMAWEEIKTKASHGGYADYPKLLSAKVEAMTTAEIGKFLILCALASDLYCPTYLSGAALPKDSKLAKEAAHYKVNAQRILREVQEKRLEKFSKPKAESKLQASAKPKCKESSG